MKIFVLRDYCDDEIYGVLTTNNDEITHTQIKEKIEEFKNSPLAYGLTEEGMKMRGYSMEELRNEHTPEYTVEEIIETFPSEWGLTYHSDCRSLYV